MDGRGAAEQMTGAGFRDPIVLVADTAQDCIANLNALLSSSAQRIGLMHNVLCLSTGSEVCGSGYPHGHMDLPLICRLRGWLIYQRDKKPLTQMLSKLPCPCCG